MISKYAPDKVRIHLLNSTCMRATDNTSAIIFDQREITLPRQAGSTEVEVSSALATAAMITLTVLLASNAVMSFVTSFLLNLLWGLINGL